MQMSSAFHKRPSLPCLLLFLLLPVAHAESPAATPPPNESDAVSASNASSNNISNTGAEKTILPPTSRRRYAVLSQDEIAKAQRYSAQVMQNSTPNEDPNGLGKFEYNGRGPGEYYDKETGMRWNGHRVLGNDGRYLQPDPIGLLGGINPYVHVRNNPLKYTDRFGLVVTVDPALRPYLDTLTTGSDVANVILKQLQNSGDTYSIKPGTGGPQTDCRGAGCAITIDLQWLSQYRYPGKNDSLFCIEPERALAHELAHASGNDSLGKLLNLLVPENTIVDAENKMMNQFDPKSVPRNPNNNKLYRK